MKYWWARFFVLCGVLLSALFVGCSSERNEGAGDGNSEVSDETFLMKPDRVEVLWYKAVVFSSKDSADIDQLAHIIPQAEKDSIKACMERKFDRVKHGQKIHRRTCIHRELCGDDNLRINFYRGDKLKEDIFFWTRRIPSALKDFLDKKGVIINATEQGYEFYTFY